MPSFFFDTSAIVKRYGREAGSDFVEELTQAENDNIIILAAITRVEVAATIARKLKGEDISKSYAADSLAAFNHDLTNRYLTVDISPELLSVAMKMATKHALRGYDAVQLAAALDANDELLANDLPPLTVVSADGELNLAAEAEGLLFENPNDH
ncbi:MAG: type II toxin-antitoxin system VapC family toxin [Pyrinomonadaceae bacterium]